MNRGQRGAEQRADARNQGLEPSPFGSLTEPLLPSLPTIPSKTLIPRHGILLPHGEEHRTWKSHTWTGVFIGWSLRDSVRHVV